MRVQYLVVWTCSAVCYTRMQCVILIVTNEYIIYANYLANV